MDEYSRAGLLPGLRKEREDDMEGETCIKYKCDKAVAEKYKIDFEARKAPRGCITCKKFNGFTCEDEGGVWWEGGALEGLV